ncbi:SDR family oxidoreductase [Peribacillus frigoritolerans]|uniref:SDR family oxidoreductase n=1 Tax=Peribacillus frigoritolerans TaxID=450367 RepID=UPI0022801688|nr:SDR family oxidoreductase [Peribacillus frigoritolerans]MCY9003210.1 SDR family oxidoreductase [Peribacillus frigoritolerans]
MDVHVVVITGAGSGLGASLAKKYSDLGCHVCLLGRTQTKLIRTAETLSHNHSIYEVDISSKSDVAKVMQLIKEEVGQIDLLINNAGVGIFDLTENLSEESIHQMIDINLKGTIFCTQEVLNDMKKRNQGYIVNIVSLSGKRGKAIESVYSASKFGARGFTESLAIELEHTAIRVFGAYMENMKTVLWGELVQKTRLWNRMMLQMSLWKVSNRENTHQLKKLLLKIIKKNIKDSETYTIFKLRDALLKSLF